jgi:hypothetical protein
MKKKNKKYDKQKDTNTKTSMIATNNEKDDIENSSESATSMNNEEKT